MSNIERQQQIGVEYKTDTHNDTPRRQSAMTGKLATKLYDAAATEAFARANDDFRTLRSAAPEILPVLDELWKKETEVTEIRHMLVSSFGMKFGSKAVNELINAYIAQNQ